MDTSSIKAVAESPEEAVATVILLDQLPRNMFRGMEAAKVRAVEELPRETLIECRHITSSTQKVENWPNIT
jgi:uncharacterized protein (DUF924 family)